MAKNIQADSHVLGKTFAVLGLIFSVVNAIWHGVLGQPSVMALLYPGFSFTPAVAVGTIVAAVIGGYIVGWLLAVVYNWAAKK